MTALLDEAGRPNPAAAAWSRIAQAMGLGSVDAAGKFQPWAAVEHAVWFGDTTDVELAFVGLLRQPSPVDGHSGAGDE
jgi:hypothetical protein